MQLIPTNLQERFLQQGMCACAVETAQRNRHEQRRGSTACYRDQGDLQRVIVHGGTPGKGVAPRRSGPERIVLDGRLGNSTVDVLQPYDDCVMIGAASGADTQLGS